MLRQLSSASSNHLYHFYILAYVWTEENEMRGTRTKKVEVDQLALLFSWKVHINTDGMKTAVCNFLD